MVKDSYERLLKPAIETEVRLALKERADGEAYVVFQKNLRDVLLAAPAGPKVVMGVDPGFRTGVKLAVVDTTGKLLEHRTIYPMPPRRKWTPRAPSSWPWSRASRWTSSPSATAPPRARPTSSWPSP